MEEYMPFVWIGIAVVMAVGEAVTNQLVSIWFVVGALCAAVSSLITSSVLVQVIVFIVIAFGTLIATKPNTSTTGLSGCPPPRASSRPAT